MREATVRSCSATSLLLTAGQHGGQARDDREEPI
jgi:hypothetical protein